MVNYKKIYQYVLDEIYKGTDNPSYTLSELSLDNMIGKHNKEMLTLIGFIKPVGKNLNGIIEYLIR